MTAKTVLRLLPFALLPALLLGSAGCGSKKSGSLAPNAPPETFLHVQGPVDTVSHQVHLYWNGSDPDGEVRAFELRLLNASRPADSQWVRVPAGSGGVFDSLVTVYAPGGITDAVFEVRAVDDAGAADPTPAREDFTVTNDEPVVVFTNVPAPTDSTYGSATVSWRIEDQDSRSTSLMARVWLNGNPLDYDSTTATTFTIPSARFYQNGRWIAGPCTLNVQAVDDGGRVGPVTRAVWVVRAPYPADPAQTRGKVLLIDDVPSTGTNNFATDTLYANTLARNLPPGSYSVLRTQFNNPFRSAQDLAQTFRQFEAVVWYRGFLTSPSTLMQTYEDSISAHAGAGGRIFLEGLYLLAGYRSPGWLSERFTADRLGGSRMAAWIQPNPPDSSVGWGNQSNGRLRSSMFSDSLIFSTLIPTIPGESGGLRAFVVPDTGYVALWARVNALAPSNPEELPVSLNVPQAGGGRVMIVPFPLRIGSPASPAPPFRLLAKMLFDPVRGLLAP